MNIELFLSTLPYMLWGMLGIFSVALILIAGVALLNRLTSGRHEK